MRDFAPRSVCAPQRPSWLPSLPQLGPPCSTASKCCARQHARAHIHTQTYTQAHKLTSTHALCKAHAHTRTQTHKRSHQPCLVHLRRFCCVGTNRAAPVPLDREQEHCMSAAAVTVHFRRGRSPHRHPCSGTRGYFKRTSGGNHDWRIIT